jgi:glucose-1-phosphate cytidylyltransferase
MVLVGGKPILWHIMMGYSQNEISDFIVCTGYKGEVIREYFYNFSAMNMDFTIQLGRDPVIEKHGDLIENGWKVTVADTGPLTMTGGRVFRIRDYVGKETFMCTYGDGIADIDIRALLSFHKSHGKIATMTTVQPISRFGVIDIDKNGFVEGFHEKPQTESWVNAGFFVFEPEVFQYLDENCILENEPLSKLAQEGQLAAYKHFGFWQPMDTYRESVMLNQMWEEEEAPWKTWK